LLNEMEKNERSLFKPFLFMGAALAFIAVACGAFGTHALSERLAPRYLDVWKTGVQYHLIHSVALVALSGFADKLRARGLARTAGKLLAVGCVIFGGSLYGLALASPGPGDPLRFLGAVTPLGGVCFLSAWACLALAALREK